MRVLVVVAAVSFLRLCGSEAPPAPPGMPGAYPGMPGAVPGMPGTVPGMPGAVPGMPPGPTPVAAPPGPMGVSTIPGMPGMPVVPGVPGMPGVAVPGVPGMPGVPMPGVPGATTPVTEVAVGPHQGSLLVTASAKFEILLGTAGEVKLYVSDPAGAEIPVAEVAIASLTFEVTPTPIVVTLSPGEGFLTGTASPAPPANPVVRFDAIVRGTPLPGITATLTAPAAAAPPATAEVAAPPAPTPAPPAEATPPAAPEPPPARVAKTRPAKRPSNDNPPPRRGSPQAQTFAPQPLPPSGNPIRGNVSGGNTPQPVQVQPRPRVTVTPGAGVSSN